MNKQAFILILSMGLMMIGLNGYGQFPSELWHEGKVVLVNTDTIRGVIKYDLERDIVQIQSKSQGINVFSAKKVLYFGFLDEITRQYRQFYALPYGVTRDYKTPRYFEVLFEGKMTLLAREFVTVQTTNYGNSAFGGSTYSREVLAYRYYFLNDRGDIIRFQNSKKHLRQLLKNKESQVKQYTNRNRIRYDNKSDMIQLLSYYNSLITPQRSTNE